MGYTTDFSGEFTLDKPLKPEHKAYLEAFATTRRMKRDAALLESPEYPDYLRAAAGLPLGEEGGYYVGSAGAGDHGQTKDASVIAYNAPPAGQPGLWCQWIPSEAGTAIEWDEGEKFYNYVEWLEYLVHHFLAPWGYSLSGQVEWCGEDSGDQGVIYARGNQIEAVDSHIVNNGPSWERSAR